MARRGGGLLPPGPAALVPGQLPGPRRSAELALAGHRSCGEGCDEPIPPAPTDARPVSMWTAELGARPQYFERNGAVDVYAVVLEGKAVVFDRSEAQEPLDVPSWSAFRAPWGDIGVAGQGGAIRVVFALVSRDGPIRAALGRTEPWGERPGTIEVASLRNAEDLSWAGGKVHARLAFEDGSASLGLLMASADAPVPPHHHERSWEVIGLMSAAGDFRRAVDGGAMQPQRVEDGAVVAVPPGLEHAWDPTGERPLFALQIYAPPGPEQRFKTLAAESGPPGG